MDIIPPVTCLPTKPIRRSHGPADGSEGSSKSYYREEFRDCLRWDFGFICAFCLRHESEIMNSTKEPVGHEFWIEHFLPKAENPEFRNKYSNNYWCCWACNFAKSLWRNDGEPVLDPCKDAWADSFDLVGGRLVPKGGDPIAKRTADAYDINGDRLWGGSKVDSRKEREYLLRPLVEFARDPDIEDKLEFLERLATSAKVGEECRAFVTAVWKRTCESVKMAPYLAAKYAAEPVSAPEECRCSIECEDLAGHMPDFAVEGVIQIDF